MQDQPMELNDDDLDHVTGGTSVNGAQRPTGTDLNGLNIANVDISSMDIETALMAVQSERTKLLDTQLANQLAQVQARNSEMANLNEHESSLNQLLSTFSSKDADSKELNLGAKVGEKSIGDILKDLNPAYAGDQDGDGKLTKGEIEKAIELTKGHIDSLSQSQQMDMLRLQSMTTKRTEAFDVMTQFIKKMQDSRSQIIGNMR